MKGYLEYILIQLLTKNKFEKTDLKIKIILFLGLYQLIFLDNVPDRAAVYETVELAKQIFDKKVAAFINAILNKYLRNTTIELPVNPADRISVEYSFPRHLIEKWISYWGEENTEYLCMFYNESPLLSFRVNNLATKPNKVFNYFSRKKILVKPFMFSKNIFQTNDGDEILKDVAFEEGYITIQDPSASMVVDLMNPQENDSVLDLFAAPGGKITYVAEKMNNTGEIIAIDKFPFKIKELKRNLARLKIFNTKTIAVDAFQYGPIAPAFDKVLIDVPCSGWGVLQKKPELRWQKNQDIEELIKLQENALETASKFVNENGYLIYSTCTLNEDENERQIENFLKRHKEFKLIPATSIIEPGFTSASFMKTIPFMHHIDGAFAAKLKKTKEK
jgi:16S rRNA (cytosine967-C5)-methyltransferase